MRLTKIRIKNFRSIIDSGEITIAPLQSLVGENNSGKSNILRAIQCFLSPGAGGMKDSDFNNPENPAIIECEFGFLSDDERSRLRPYLVNGTVILQKELSIFHDEEKEKATIKSEYHGYQAEPSDEHLSIKKLEDAAGGRVRWKDVAEAAGIIEYVQDADGKVTKATYTAGIKRYLQENDVEYDEPELGETQALGIPQNLLAALPEFYLLPAITDYSDEVDRRSSSTVFRRLMADLSDRIMRLDPRYAELEAALGQVRAFLNSVEAEGAPNRLGALSGVENSIRDVIKKLMPTVEAVSLGVEIEESKEIFAKGVTIKIDDGVLTDVLDKGHGMQRSLVFSLLQMLIDNGKTRAGSRPIILGIEEPELYIHPHSQRLIFRVLREFAGFENDDAAPRGTDQVIYTTHSPAFVEVWNYDRIGLVKKPDLPTGTIVRQAPQSVLGTPDDRRAFKMLTSFGLKHNEVFFSRYVVIVEGPEDEIGVIATARKIRRIVDLPDEIGVSILVASGKGEIPKFQKVLNAFGVPYGVLLELDGNDDGHGQTAAILDVLNENRVSRVPDRVEDFLGVGRHFDDQRHAKRFFSNPENINEAFEQVVTDILPPV